MAFNTSRSATPAAARTPAASSSNTSVNISGLYEGKPESKLVLKGGALKEAVTIPAGYTIKVFRKGGKSKNGKDLPPFEVVAQAPRSQA